MDAPSAHKATTINNQANSPLLRLPAELRNQIYEHTLSGLVIRIEMSMNKENCGFTTCSTYSTIYDPRRYGLGNLSALSTVCRQLHTETHLLPFCLNDFGGYSKSFTQAIDGGHLSTEQVNAIRKVDLLLSMSNVFSSTPRSPLVNLCTVHPYLMKLAARFRSMKSLNQVEIVLFHPKNWLIPESIVVNLKIWLTSLLTKGNEGRGVSVAVDISPPPPPLRSLSYLYFHPDLQLEFDSTLSLRYSQHYHYHSTNDIITMDLLGPLTDALQHQNEEVKQIDLGKHRRLLAITATCRQLQNETEKLVFKLNAVAGDLGDRVSLIELVKKVPNLKQVVVVWDERNGPSQDRVRESAIFLEKFKKTLVKLGRASLRIDIEFKSEGMIDAFYIRWHLRRTKSAKSCRFRV
ncbi:hypothetical protein HBI33_026050 [Parastagonospora nodorum]|nr:hypothetical protein HBH84_027740 [Parastagonospora nodorum]KAH4966339.1 hypothetical protein HBI78_093600 [Parastagonospora nodorum]KAH5390403.1 hypothetical protein HBI33_026050 [Parastagonospora nodorum]